MLPEAREKHWIITTRIIKCILVKISHLYAGNFCFQENERFMQISKSRNFRKKSC